MPISKSDYLSIPICPSSILWFWIKACSWIPKSYLQCLTCPIFKVFVLSSASWDLLTIIVNLFHTSPVWWFLVPLKPRRAVKPKIGLPKPKKAFLSWNRLLSQNSFALSSSIYARLSGGWCIFCGVEAVLSQRSNKRIILNCSFFSKTSPSEKNTLFGIENC